MKIQIPTNCPCCDSVLVLVNDQLFCRNSQCSAQLNKKLEHFCKTLKIKGLGPKSIEKLQLQDLLEIFYLDPSDLAIALQSEKLAQKLVEEIEKAKHASFGTVLAAFSIPLIGDTAGSKLEAVVSSFDEITQETCKLAGLGDKATANLLNWLETEYAELKEFLPFSFKPRQQNSGDQVCITGKLTSFANKSEATQKLEQLGFVVTDSVTKTTKYLVDEQNNGSAKRKKAEAYGITIVSNLIKFLEEQTQ